MKFAIFPTGSCQPTAFIHTDEELLYFFDSERQKFGNDFDHHNYKVFKVKSPYFIVKKNGKSIKLTDKQEIDKIVSEPSFFHLRKDNVIVVPCGDLIFDYDIFPKMCIIDTHTNQYCLLGDFRYDLCRFDGSFVSDWFPAYSSF